MTALHGIIPAGGTASVTGPARSATRLAEALSLTFPPWHADALCVEYPEVNFFPAQGEHDVAKAAQEVCRRCLVVAECRDYAMSDASLVGVWGGTTVTDRARARARRRGEGRSVGQAVSG